MTSLESKLVYHARLISPNCPGNYHHVSFITHRNRIISVGINSYKTHTLSAKFGFFNAHTHAELSSIVNFPKNLDITKHTLYVCRIRTNGSLGLSKPCKRCQNLILAFNLKGVKFSTDYNSFDTWF